MKDLKISTRCPKPFDTITVDKNGNCYACECSGWLPEVVGNLKMQNLQDILHKEKLHHIQQSIINGNYKYCKENLCSWLLDKRNNGWTNDIPANKLKNIRLGIDDSCNLSCPSCRLTQIFEKRGIRLNSRLNMAKKIISYLQSINHDVVVHLGSDGDPFASLVYRYFLKHCPRKDNISFSIQTNGLLLKKMFNKNKWMFGQLKTLGLSIDGCTKDTYEKLRRGGNFDILCDNLKFINKIKTQYQFKLVYHFVVQKNNYQEMLSYIDFAKSNGADQICFNRIVDWKTYKIFRDQDVVDVNHSEHQNYKKYFAKLEDVARRHDLYFIGYPTLN